MHVRWLIVVCLVLAACIYAHLEEAPVLAGVADDLISMAVAFSSVSSFSMFTTGKETVAAISLAL